MKIVENTVRGEGLIKKYDLSINVMDVLAVDRDIAGKLIHSEDCFIVETKDDYKEFNGKCFLCYPLGVIVEIDIQHCDLVGQAVWDIAQAYSEIYKEEVETMQTPIEEKDEDDFSNRNATDGKYKIWGHALYDLYIETIAFYNNGIVDIFVGS